MSRNCSECMWPNRQHADWCRSRGYAAVGPHPDAPQAEPPKPTVVEVCPCGIARLDCDYHRPGSNADAGPATERNYEVYDVVVASDGLLHVLSEIWS